MPWKRRRKPKPPSVPGGTLFLLAFALAALCHFAGCGHQPKPTFHKFPEEIIR